VRTSAVVVAGVFAGCSAEVLFAEDEHAVGGLGAGGEDESFGVGVRPGAAGWDLADGDAGVGQDAEGRTDACAAARFLLRGAGPNLRRFSGSLHPRE
jgi:hypothetical protein